MAFIVLGDREQEWERRPLERAITIGRSFDCELPVRDTQLSRQHCRLEPHGNQWVLIDLQSRNGTRIGETLITRQALRDGDVVHIGQTRLCFRAGPFVSATVPKPHSVRPRPLDPHEAMAATLNGVSLTDEPDELRLPGFPRPKPRPSEPKSFREDGVENLVSSIASKVWDAKLANRALSHRPPAAVPWMSEPKPVAPQSVSIGHRKVIAQTMQKPAKWLVMAYLVLTGAVFTAALAVIIAPVF
jgi:predicted component of type VI protein secretion system